MRGLIAFLAACLAAGIAQRAHVRMLLFTHVIPPLPFKALNGPFLGKAREIFKGQIRVGRDGDFVTLPPRRDGDPPHQPADGAFLGRPPMALFAPSTNADYRGSNLAVGFLALSGLLTLIPGLIHYFLPDGGAGVIAHIDLATRADTIIAIFAWYGAMQIPFGLFVLIIALRYRSLVPLTLLMLLILQSLSAYSAWFWKGAHGGRHPPEHYGSAAFVGLGVVFLLLSLRAKTAR